jgi:uncharacterized phage-associated protein
MSKKVINLFPSSLGINNLYLMKYLVFQKSLISNLWIQKLIYFIYRYHAKNNNVFQFDEEFETWEYGPVFRSLYRNYKKWESEFLIYF